MQLLQSSSVLKYSVFVLVSLFIVSLAPFTEVGKASFYLLFLISIIYLLVNLKSLKNTDKDVKLVFYSLIAWFVWTVLTNIINGVPELSMRSLWRRQSFILALIPLYYLFKAYPIPARWLENVAIIAAVNIFGYGVYEMVYTNSTRLTGGEHPIQYASIALLLMIYLVSVLMCSMQNRWKQILIVLSITLLFLSILMTSSRGVWLVLPLLFIMWMKQLPYNVSVKNKSIAVMIMVVILGSIYLFTPAKQRIDITITNITNYYNSTDVSESARGTSIGTRFEMWKAAWFIFTEKPITGVGLGGYQAAAIKYQEKNNYSNTAYGHYHPHNQYLSELVSKGLPGLVLFVLLAWKLFRYFYRNYKQEKTKNKIYAFTGMQYVISVLVLCLTNATFEAKSMVIAMAVFFALMISMNQLENSAD